MHIRRMMAAIEIAVDIQVSRKPFNITEWFHSASDPHDCSTAACLAGHMARDPWMRAEGLEIFAHKDAVPIYCGEPGIVGIARFLDIGLPATMYVFLARSYFPLDEDEVTAGMVAVRLRDIVRQHLRIPVSRRQKNSSAAEATEQLPELVA